MAAVYRRIVAGNNIYWFHDIMLLSVVFSGVAPFATFRNHVDTMLNGTSALRGRNRPAKHGNSTPSNPLTEDDPPRPP